jgi:hypothetical protein
MKLGSVESNVHLLGLAAQPYPSAPDSLKAPAWLWDAIMRSRGLSEWQPVDLALAQRLAETMHAIDREDALLNHEGLVLNGKINPRFSVQDTLFGQMMALTRALRLSGGATGKRRDVLKTRAAEIEARKTLQATKCDLLAS